MTQRIWRASVLLAALSAIGCSEDKSPFTNAFAESPVTDAFDVAPEPHDAVAPDVPGFPMDTSALDDASPVDDTLDAPDLSPFADAPGPEETGVAADLGQPDAEALEPEDTGLAVDSEQPDVNFPARYPPGRIHSPITASVVQRLMEIRALDPVLGTDVFMKVGASTTASNSYLGCFANGATDLGVHSDLQVTLDFFLAGDAAGADPFSRKTLAAKIGVSAVWAISGDPSPLEQEYLALEPSLAFVHYGTNDIQLGTTPESALWGFGENLWTLIDELIGWGVIPIAVSIGHRLDDDAVDSWVPTYNAVIAGLAQGRQVPFLDQHLAYEALPNYGISGDGVHSSVYPGGACLLTEAGLPYGMNTRNLHSLEALDRMRRVALDAQALDPPGPALQGTGTLDDPFIVIDDEFPFTDMRSTSDSPSSIFDTYSGCGSTADESGPERIYRLDLAAPAHIRATVHDRGSVDIDLHVLDETASVTGCLSRAHRIIGLELEAGTHYIVLDTFVSDGVENSGEYLFTLQTLP